MLVRLAVAAVLCALGMTGAAWASEAVVAVGSAAGAAELPPAAAIDSTPVEVPAPTPVEAPAPTPVPVVIEPAFTEPPAPVATGVVTPVLPFAPTAVGEQPAGEDRLPVVVNSYPTSSVPAGHGRADDGGARRLAVRGHALRLGGDAGAAHHTPEGCSEHPETRACARFFDNPCVEDSSSQACAEFLYPVTCRRFDCSDLLAFHPCVLAPSSDECEVVVTNPCFDQPTGPRCMFVRAALTQPGNPCRTDRRSAECERYAQEHQCELRGLTGRACTLVLDVLRLFTAERAARCLSNSDSAHPGSLCALYYSAIGRGCETSALACRQLFGGSREELGILDRGDRGPDFATSLTGLRSGDRFATALVGDAGERLGAGARSPLTAGDGDALASTGHDLANLVLLALIVLSVGAGLRTRVAQASGRRIR